jgi:hypothetical protein
LIEDSIIKRILACWEADQVHPSRGRDQRLLPSFNDIKEVMDIAFLASIQQEEGRPIRFSIALAAKEETNGPSHRYPIEPCMFQPPLPFTVESTAKLAPAFDPALASIAVGRNPNTKKLECWGAYFYGGSSHRFNEVLTHRIGRPGFRPDIFTVTTQAPAVLQISRQNSRIGRLAGGDFIPASPTPFSSKSLGRYLIEPLTQTDLWKEKKEQYWHFYRDALEVLLAEALSRGHGGTIVILDGRGVEDYAGLFSPRFGLKRSTYLNLLFRKALENDHPNIGAAYNKLILEALQSLAQMATVDGAMILTLGLDIVAFGATLNAPKWNRKVLIGPNGFGYNQGDISPAQRYGTPHSSAINFAGAYSGCIVFVISQDGGIRGFVKSSEDTVLCWPDCNTSMFV